MQELEILHSPLISVIIPVYNVEKYISNCVESVLNQTYANFEVILVDDGSPDNSGAICDKYAMKDSRVRVIHKQNKGVSAARNTGIDESRGEYICFIDSDDWIEATYLEDFVKCGLKPNGIIYSGITNDYDDGRHTAACQYENESTELNLGDFIVRHRLIHNGYPWAKALCRKTIIDHNLRFDTNISFHEDHLFVLNYLQYAESLGTVSNLGYHYMHHGGGQSLSSKKHKPSNLAYAGSLLIEVIDKLLKQYCINNAVYIRKAYTDNALNHIMIALLQTTKTEEPAILKEYNSMKEYFRKFYYPNNSIARLFAMLIFVFRNTFLQSIALIPLKLLYKKRYENSRIR